MKNKLKILFLCTGNSCRSQMAEGWAKKLQADDIEAFSAGVKPKKIDPRAVKAMAEAGVDISGQGFKDVKDLMHISFDYVITLCGHAHETCPLFPGKTKVIHHGFDDPPRLAATAKTDDEAMMPYRRVRDEIRDFVRGLPDNLKDEGMGFKLNL
jgi:arsenate reductase